MERLHFVVDQSNRRISIFKRHLLFFKKKICEIGYDLTNSNVFIVSESGMTNSYKPVSEALINSVEFMEAIEGNAMDFLLASASIGSFLASIKHKN